MELRENSGDYRTLRAWRDGKVEKISEARQDDFRVEGKGIQDLGADRG